jgi:hypothetical protein
MLSAKQEKIVVQFKVGLCKMHKGNLAGPYESATIETDSTPDAIDKAKRWARTVEDIDGAWLQILLEGKSVASFKPGEF